MIIALNLWVLLMGSVTGLLAISLACTKYRGRDFAAVSSGMAFSIGIIGALMVLLKLDFFGLGVLPALDLFFGFIGLYGWFKTREQIPLPHITKAMLTMRLIGIFKTRGQSKEGSDDNSTMGIHSIVTPFIGALLSYLASRFDTPLGQVGFLIFPLSLGWGLIVAVVALCCGERWRGLVGIGLLINASSIIGILAWWLSFPKSF